MTRATGVGSLPDLLNACGGEKTLRSVFTDANLPLALTHDRTHRLPLSSLARLYQAAAERTGNPVFGLTAGLAMTPDDFGKWAQYASQGATLEDGISRAIETLHLHQSGTVMRLAHRPDGHVALEYAHPDVSNALFRQHSDHVVPNMIRFIQSFMGHEWRPCRVEAAYPAPNHADRLEAMIGAAWDFDRPCPAVVMSREDLRAPNRQIAEWTPKTPLLTYADVEAEARLDWPDDLVENIAAVVSLRMLDGLCDIEGAAEILGMGCRTLQRELQGNGLTYRSLVTLMRMERAKDLIKETALPIKGVCFKLGYSDPAHFTRAFQKHFGYPPSQLRGDHADA